MLAVYRSFVWGSHEYPEIQWRPSGWATLIEYPDIHGWALP